CVDQYNNYLDRGDTFSFNLVLDGIHAIETYDVTTVRASATMFLMARKIKSLGVKMVISGEGADEIFGGYLYFHKAPNKGRKIKAIHLHDCLRANKSTFAWDVEAGVPLIDKEFINVVMSIDPEMKMIDMEKNRIEKWTLRKAFDDEDHPYLPKVSAFHSWINGPKSHAEVHVVQAACTTDKAIEWDAAWSNHLDPSGRAAFGVHDSAYELNRGPDTNATKIVEDEQMMMDTTVPELTIGS
ncbi:hypothetical protein M8C21_004268, partial [Ambrosia artemisiifolia]